MRIGLAFRRAVGRELRAAMWHTQDTVMVWGADDCALWIGSIIRDARGKDEFGCLRDPAKAYRRRYTTQRGAHRVMGRSGLIGVARQMEREDGWRRLARPCDARIGDVGIALVNGVASAVICYRKGFWVGRNEQGFTAVRTRDERGKPVVRMAWAVD